MAFFCYQTAILNFFKILKTHALNDTLRCLKIAETSYKPFLRSDAKQAKMAKNIYFFRCQTVILDFFKNLKRRASAHYSTFQCVKLPERSNKPSLRSDAGRTD
jgi:hypothetical protein